jgi:hypothetical protein
METKLNKITIKNYLDFSQLLSVYKGSHEENRLFGLKNEQLLKTPNTLLLNWYTQHSFRVSDASNSSKFSYYSTAMNNLLGFFSLFIGLLIGLGLLSYSGESPINVIYYLFVVMLLPLISMIITLFSMLSSKGISNFLTLLFPLHWMENFFHWFSFKDKMEFLEKNFSSNLQKWMFLNRLQLFSLLFSLGLLLALIFMVVTQDIAFSWSTTLQVDVVTFQSFLDAIATPWKLFFPSLVPSVELVEISQHYRLGDKFNSNLTEHASRLGEWWKFLAMTTFFYAIILRFSLWLFTQYQIVKVVEKDFLNIEGINKILREFNTPFISTKAPTFEQHLKITGEQKTQIKKISQHNKVMQYEYNHIIGWNFSFDEILLINDFKKITALLINSVGGSHSFVEDEKVAFEATNSVVLYVKSWEPPTMDFVDFLEELINNKKINEIQVFPLGTIDNHYMGTSKEFSIWNRKIESLESKKVWIIDAE